ncbi:Pr6Pr family membrane protein [Cryobacterium sp. SO2]|uniref:Pr6Pr family membrane protein n=1 Tax=Cryobacterium sp. SO2 TaxID=1897060 RepID=UPI00223D981C|nr:Pr6Pr family membrane protein [Cryobacterium sp. SO2]WEO76626.1 Pr6Pr family membrane protein [Cryobacterium sp. SO2]
MRVPAPSIAVLRLILAALTVIAVAATFLSTAARATINPFNFFGFFTIQSNLLAAVVLAGTAVLCLLGREVPAWLVLARAATTAYMIVVGLVYNTLLTGLAGGVDLPWANTVVHVLFPIYCLIDWALVGDRAPQPWRRLWVVLIYPVFWCAVVLVRGATDGWVPYPFLNPVTGYAAVFGYVLLIAVTVIVTGAAVFGLSRLRPLPVRPGSPATTRG